MQINYKSEHSLNKEVIKMFERIVAVLLLLVLFHDTGECFGAKLKFGRS